MLSLAVSIRYGQFASTKVVAGDVLLGKDKNMFRISTIDTNRERRLVVEGTLVHAWVAELRRSWGAAGSSLEGRNLVIDLTNATMIDQEGEAAICELMREGAKFSCSGVLTKDVVRRVAQKCRTGLKDVLYHQRAGNEGEGR